MMRSSRLLASVHTRSLQQATAAPLRLRSALRESEKRCEDSISRYPETTPQGLLRTLDYVGTALFACTGCLTAGAAGMDVFGCTMVGATTALGGGTVRDVMLGNTPVSWVTEPEYLKIAIGCAFGTFLCWSAFGDYSSRMSKAMDKFIFWIDSAGLGAFAIIGVQNALRRGLGAAPAVLCGVMTATFGGVIRDLLCNKPVRVMNTHHETYAAAPLSAAMVYIAARHAGLALASRTALCLASSMSVRYYAVENDFKLPTLQPKLAAKQTQTQEGSECGSCPLCGSTAVSSE
eukprot:TRINITY_DN13359_c0_g1_i1.p1 TRINITY_DN13359_c0_g1~~TRINITY_DN13359_c0_g1_i1.p1  ORF type:complete len:290 (+),score=93.69 TRINITY_DN13359_c0_g1_i1:388-1257(+)